MGDAKNPTLTTAGVPWCSREACPAFDGKRCELLGHRPDPICGPAVAEMASGLTRLRALEQLATDVVTEWLREPHDPPRLSIAGTGAHAFGRALFALCEAIVPGSTTKPTELAAEQDLKAVFAALGLPGEGTQEGP